jgi:hypothetical protein
MISFIANIRRGCVEIWSDPFATLQEAHYFVAKHRSRLAAEKIVISEIGHDGEEVREHQASDYEA